MQTRSFSIITRNLGISAASLFLLQAGLASAQKIPDLVVAPKGQTINMSLQTGSKSTLAFGTNTSFGANLSTQSSPGMTATATSNFTPLEASITSQIGSGPALGKTTASISNLRAQGTGNTTIAGSPILASDANYASGEAILDGVGATVSIVLDPEKSGFMIEGLPNVVGGVACNGSSGTACQYTDSLGKKPYDEQQFASGNASASITSNTTVDINNTQFTSTFAQSF